VKERIDLDSLEQEGPCDECERRQKNSDSETPAGGFCQLSTVRKIAQIQLFSLVFRG
jgi:hypothetical protein